MSYALRFCLLPLSSDVEADRLFLMIKWSEASMMS